VIISIDAEKGFDKIQYPFMIRSDESMNGRNIAQHNKGYTWQTYYQHTKTKSFPLKLGMRQGCPLFPLLFDKDMDSLARAIRQEEEIKGIQIEKEEINLSIYTPTMN
jgi:hypothetical protein